MTHTWRTSLPFSLNTFLTLSATRSTSPPILVMLSFTGLTLLHSLTACFSLCLFVSLRCLITTCPSTGAPLAAPPTSSSHPLRSRRRRMERWRLAKSVRGGREEQHRYASWCMRAKDEEEKTGRESEARQAERSRHIGIHGVYQRPNNDANHNVHAGRGSVGSHLSSVSEKMRPVCTTSVVL